VNVPLTISAVVASPMRLATLHELQTVYGARDLFDFLEIMSVQRHNEALQAKHQSS
jgi:hypothetical protein